MIHDPAVVRCVRAPSAAPSGRRAVATALAAGLLVTAAAIVGLASPSAAIVPAPPLAPTWAVDVPTSSPTDPASGFDADRLGRTYLTVEGGVYARFAADGSPDRTVGHTGTGSVEVRDLSAGDDLGVSVTGHVDGTVTLAGAAGPVVLTGDHAGFVARFDDAGLVIWSRLVPDAGDEVNIFEVHQSGETVAVSGQFFGTITVGDRTIDDDHLNWFVAGFDTATGAPSWLTGVVPTEEPEDNEPAFLYGGTDEGSLALVGVIGVGRTIVSAGPTQSIDCTPYAPQDLSESCFALIDLDLATGEPLLARRLGPDVDEAWRVAPTADGYVVTGERDLAPPSGPVNQVGFAMALDSVGNPLWTQTLRGMEHEIDVEVDQRGDVVVADTASQVDIGDDASAVRLDGRGSISTMMAELDGGDGSFVRGTVAGAAGNNTFLHQPGLAIGPDDAVLLAARHAGDTIVGSGPRAIALTGAASFIASFPPDQPPEAGSTFHPTTPTRLLDSRTATGGWNGKLVAGTPRPLTVAGVAGVPADATAVVLNLTATDVSAMTYLVGWPTGQIRPTASTLNVVAGDTTSNQATIAVGEGGAITIATAQGTTNVVADLLGWYAADGSGSVYQSADPVRLLDSRTSTGGWNGKLVAGAPRPLTVAGTSDIPADATAVTLSVTVTDTSQLTYLRVQPTGSVAANSNIAVNAGQTIANLVTVPIGTGGAITFTNNSGSVNVVADVVGFYDHDTNNGSLFHAVSPRRVLDSRTGNGGYTTPWPADTTRAVSLQGALPSEADITAVVTNLTATDTTAMSYLTLFGPAPRPSISNLLVTPGQTIAVAVNTEVAADGTVSLYNQLGSANLVLDIDGYFIGPPAP